MAGCGSSGYGANTGLPASGAVGRGRSLPAATAVHGIPAAAARTLRQTAKIGWRLNGAEIFGGVRAPVFGSGPFDLAAAGVAR